MHNSNRINVFVITLKQNIVIASLGKEPERHTTLSTNLCVLNARYSKSAEQKIVCDVAM